MKQTVTIYQVMCSATSDSFFFNYKPTKKDIIALGEQIFGLTFEGPFEEFSVHKLVINTRDSKKAKSS